MSSAAIAVPVGRSIAAAMPRTSGLMFLIFKVSYFILVCMLLSMSFGWVQLIDVGTGSSVVVRESDCVLLMEK